MFRAGMPEASIDKYCETVARKHDVYLTPKTSQQTKVHPKPEPPSMKL
jgi:hypothetical protein